MNFKITLTFSKMTAIITLIMSFILSIYLKDTTPFITAVPFAAATLGLKQYLDKNKLEIDGK